MDWGYVASFAFGILLGVLILAVYLVDFDHE